MKIKKFGKTREDTRWKRGEFVIAERVGKQNSWKKVRKRMKRGLNEMRRV